MGSENYTLGRGELYFDKFTANTRNRTGERYLGNSPELNLTTESETLDHFNSDRGIRVKDKSILLEKSDSGSFILDEISNENVALWFLGDVSVRAQSAVAAPATENVPANRVMPGTYYQIGATLANPTGLRNVTVTTITSDPVGTTYVLNTDYTVDEELGRVYVVPGGAIDGTDPIIINYTAVASTREQVIVGEGTTIEGSLRFISFNPSGPRRDYWWPYVQLRADGDLALKGDEWQQLSFAFDILKLDGYSSQYIDGRPVATP